VCVLLLAVLAAYANHFENGFHFDDFHTITTNVFIGELRNIPRFFTDVSLFTREPENATYRPITSASLAIDYWLGHGLKPFWFHLSTFLWFAVQLVLMFFLFRRIMDRADPQHSDSRTALANSWTALAATACYGLHPANAETVNYIIQRADLYGTLGVVASLLWFVAYPAQRKWGWYLLPAVAAYLSKAPALIYPLILLAYVWLFERGGPKGATLRAAFRTTLPAFLVTAAAGVFSAKMTPATFNPGAASAWLYRLTQPRVALHYFKSFFLPTELSADSDWTYVSGPFSGEAVAGYLFVIGLLGAAFFCARQRGGVLSSRPIAFGIFWFFLALTPTSLMPLADLTTDHRMFFPFVGLALAVFWGLRLVWFRLAARLASSSPPLSRVGARGAAAALVVVMAAEAAGTHQRNAVWHSEESLWRDVTVKSPGNGRGLLTYGGAFLERGDYATALSYYERAAAYIPNHWVLAANRGMAYAGLQRDAEAERHFRRAIVLAPGEADPYFFYGRWLQSKGRIGESQAQLEAAVRVNRLSFPARYLLMQIYSDRGNRAAYDGLVQETLQLAYNDETARRYLESLKSSDQARPSATPEGQLHISAEYCRAGKYEDCIAAAKKALALRPDYAEAYNNIAASYIALERWDEGIQAATEAIRLKPDFELAKKNLQRARALKEKALKGGG
jgi:tetratricopeptide (TPR) repeat protein